MQLANGSPSTRPPKSGKRPRAADESILDELQVAKMIGVSVRTVRGWRRSGKGPRFTKIGRIVRYAKQRVYDWLAERECSSNDDAKPYTRGAK